RRRRRGHPQAHTSIGVGQRPTLQHNGLPTTPVQPLLPPSPGSAHRPTQERRHETPDTASEEAAHAQALQELAELEQAWHEHIAATRSPHEATTLEYSEAQRAQIRIDRPFPPDRLATMYREVERLAARLLSRQALRTRRAHAGRFDVRRTVVRGLRSGTEVPCTLAYRRRKLSKLRLIVLGDV